MNRRLWLFSLAAVTAGFLILTGIQAKDFNESEPPVSDTVRFQEADQHVWKFKPVNGTLCRRLADRLDSRLTGVNPDEQELVYCVRLGVF